MISATRSRGSTLRRFLPALFLSAIASSYIPAAVAQGLPDMIVRTDILEQQWVVRDEPAEH
jgi:hypothetical protein